MDKGLNLQKDWNVVRRDRLQYVFYGAAPPAGARETITFPGGLSSTNSSLIPSLASHLLILKKYIYIKISSVSYFRLYEVTDWSHLSLTGWLTGRLTVRRPARHDCTTGRVHDKVGKVRHHGGSVTWLSAPRHCHSSSSSSTLHSARTTPLALLAPLPVSHREPLWRHAPHRPTTTHTHTHTHLRHAWDSLSLSFSIRPW